MTNRINQYRELQRQLAEAQDKLASLETDVQIDKEIKSKVDAILSQYGRPESYLLELYSLSPAKGKDESKKRRVRSVKVYQNPHTGEVIESKGGPNALLQLWKSEHGKEEVESWLKAS